LPTDNDGLYDGQEVEFNSDPLLVDTDEDGIGDAEEVQLNTNLTLADSDKDGLSDGQEVQINTNPLLADSDEDGLSDGTEVDAGTNPLSADSDADGLIDAKELELGTQPLAVDTDNDGLTDGEEVELGLNALLADSDADGLSDQAELEFDTNPVLADSDEDSLTDGREIEIGTNPLAADTDSDGLSDSEEIQLDLNPLATDTDSDGVSDYAELENKTDPLLADSDEDGILDGEELELGSNPLLEDTDADGLSDSRELELQTNLLIADSDGDGLTDAEEIIQGTNPLVAQATAEPEPEVAVIQADQQQSQSVINQQAAVQPDSEDDALQTSIDVVSQSSQSSVDQVDILQQSDQNWKWITGQNKNKFTVQLFNSSNLDQTIDFLKSYNLVSEARIVPSLQGGIVFYKAIMGSYDNWLSAGQKVASLPKSLRSTTPLIRTFVSLYPENPHAQISENDSQAPVETIVKVEEKTLTPEPTAQPQTAPVNKKEIVEPQAPKVSRPQSQPAPAVIIKRAPNIFGSGDEQSSLDQPDTSSEPTVIVETKAENTIPQLPSVASSPQIVSNLPEQSTPTATLTPQQAANPLFDNQIIKGGMSKSDLSKIQSALKLVEDKQYQSAINILTPMANSRNADARYRLALMVHQGLGSKKRPKFAFNLAKLAAEQGHRHAKQLLGQFYVQGYGVAANPIEASKWL